MLGNPNQGTVSVDPISGVITYTPDPGFFGTDSFTYTVKDYTDFLSNVATVIVSVAEPGKRVTQGLVVYYPLLTGTGSVVKDYSNTGTPMDLALTGDVNWVTGSNDRGNSGVSQVQLMPVIVI